ncbi:monothiol glutaredoxin-S15, mitochondrial-like [Hibiscus syriacus]|uniref:monothiol glutaredoxin-S15, mitochondrial-like n=1 Tax=Hibiscus syriacus TaxID=106335 RepID=UPI001921500A|nr:monothiol glutaredoxin-S15, mitochondrial-like [Hibiscus syriacus]
MARLLSSNTLLRAIATLPAARSNINVIGSFYQNGLKYSTVPREPDINDEFRLTNKVQDSAAVSFKDIVEQDVKENPVMIYINGVPDFPQCGFSSLVVRVYSFKCKKYPELKSAIKAFRLFVCVWLKQKYAQ